MQENKFTAVEIATDCGLEILLKNNLNGEHLTLLPDSGGRIKELSLSNGISVFSILKKIETVHSENRDDIFNNAKLSPFAGRIKDGVYFYLSQEYQLALNYPEENNACHGFVYDKKFIVTEKTVTENSVSCRLNYEYSGDQAGYPFQFLLSLIYTLTESNGVTCATEIKNLSQSPMPLCDGWHFYFDLGTNVDDLLLKTEPCEMMKLDAQMIPTGVTELFEEFISSRYIGGRKFDSCFKIISNGEPVTVLKDEKKNIELRIHQSSTPGNDQYLVIYTPPERKTIAIEPMTSNVNAFNNGEGLITLLPQETFQSCVRILLNKIN